MLAGQAALGVVGGQLHLYVAVLVLPVTGLAGQCSTLRMSLQASGPGLIGAGFRWQTQGLSLLHLLIRGLQIFQQQSPGHAVHRQVMHHQQQALARRAHVHQQGAQQRAVLQIQAGLRGVAQFKQFIGIGGLALPQHLGAVPLLGLGLLPDAVDITQPQTQRVVMFYQRGQGLLQAVAVQRLAQFQQQRLVPVVTGLDVLLEEPVLDRRQQHLATHRPLVDDQPGAAYRDLRQALHGLVLEQVPRGDANPGLTRAADHLDRDDRVAAQFEEVVVDAHALELEHVLPDRRQLGLQLIHRRRVGLLRQRCVGLGQCSAIEFAVAGQRPLVEFDQMRRHHVVRQTGLQMFTQGVAQIAVVAARGEPRDQLRAAIDLRCQDQRLLDGRMALQTILDFPQFDAETTDLHLMVDTPGVLDAAIGAITRQIAGAIQARARLGGEQVRDEPRGGQVGTLVITAGKAGTADVQLTDAALGHRVQARVEHVPAQIADRLPQRRAIGTIEVGAGQRAVSHVHGGFGDAVHIDQQRLPVVEGVIPRTQAGHVQRLATEHHIPQGHVWRIGAGERHQLAKGRRGLVEYRDSLITEQAGEVFRGAADRVGHHHQLAAVEQRAKDFPHGKVEGIGVEQAPHILRIETEPVLGGAEQPRQVAVGQQRAFGFAGGTGGVDDVGQVRWSGQVRQVVGTGLKQPVAGVIEADHFNAFVQRQLRQQRGIGQQQARAAVGEHVGQAVLRVLRVQRHIGATGLEDRQQADDHLQRTLQGDAHQHIGADTALAQAMGDAVGAAVQFGVSEGDAVAGHGDVVRVRGGLGFDQLMGAQQVRLIAVQPGSAIPVEQCGLLLGGVEHAQVRQGNRAVSANRLQQVQPVPAETLDGRGVEQLGGVDERRVDALVALDGVEHQVELGGFLIPDQRFDAQPRQVPALRAATVALVVEHHLEQRRVAQAALHAQAIDQLLERQVLMGLCAERRGLDLGQQLPKRLVGPWLAAQHLGIDEKAQQVFHVLAGAVGNRHADTNVLLAAVAMQQCLQRCHQHHEQGAAFAAGKITQLGGQRSGDFQLDAGPLLARDRRATTVGRQVQWRVFAAQLHAPVIELAIGLAGLQPQPLPAGEVGVLNARLR
ncbi:hypothetical protein D3C76_419170 [compost metagenome]